MQFQISSNLEKKLFKNKLQIKEIDISTENERNIGEGGVTYRTQWHYLMQPVHEGDGVYFKFDGDHQDYMIGFQKKKQISTCTCEEIFVL